MLISTWPIFHKQDDTHLDRVQQQLTTHVLPHHYLSDQVDAQQKATGRQVIFQEQAKQQKHLDKVRDLFRG